MSAFQPPKWAVGRSPRRQVVSLTVKTSGSAPGDAGGRPSNFARRIAPLAAGTFRFGGLLYRHAARRSLRP